MVLSVGALAAKSQLNVSPSSRRFFAKLAIRRCYLRAPSSPSPPYAQELEMVNERLPRVATGEWRIKSGLKEFT